MSPRTTLTAALQHTQTAPVPALAGAPRVFTGPLHTLRVWDGAEGDVAGDAASVVMVEGRIDNIAVAASAAGMSADDCRQRPAGALLAALKREPALLDTLRGAFWIAVVDLAEGVVRLRSDPLGFRVPLFTAVPGGWAWSADLEPLIAWGNRRDVERSVLPAVLNTRFVLSERTLVAGVLEAQPLCEITLRDGAHTLRRWTTVRFAPHPAAEPRAAWAARLDRALDTAFAGIRSRHGRVGVLLSGGVDSALLAAKARGAGFSRLIAYSAQIEGSDNEETARARRVAQHLGIEHVVVDVTDATIAATAEGVLRRVQMVPRNNSDFVVAALLERAAGEVDAVLYGEAADTLFGSSLGIRLENIAAKRRRIAWIPRPVQRGLAAALGRWPGHRQRRLRRLLQFTAAERAQRMHLLDTFTPPSHLMRGLVLDAPDETDAIAPFDPATDDVVEWAQSQSLVGECRIHWRGLVPLAPPGLAVEIPFVTDDVIALAQRLPRAYHRDGSLSKPLVRDVAAAHLPAGYVTLPKLGFPVPAGRWLAGPLKPWVDEATGPDARIAAFLDMKVVRSLRAPGDAELILTVAMLERFMRLFFDRGGRP